MACFRRPPHRYRSHLVALATVAAALSAAPAARADDYYSWAGGAYDNWSESNWYMVGGGGKNTGHADFGYSTYLSFGSYRDDNGIVNDDIGTSGVQLLSFSGQDWTVNGSQIRFDEDGSMMVTSTDNQGINVKITNDIHFVTDFLYNRTNLPVTIDAGSTLTLTGHLDNDGGIDKKGDGTLVLGGFHNYLGDTIVDGGRIVDDHIQGNYHDNANLEFHSDTDQTFTQSIVGAGILTKSGGATLDLAAGSISYTGKTVVNEGRLILQVPTSSAIEIASGAAFETRMTQTTTYNGHISGEGSFTKSGTGILTLTNDDYTGGTTVSGGFLIDKLIHGDYNLAGGFLQTTVDAGNTNTDSGVISGTGSLSKYGDGTLILTGVNTYPTTNILAGKLIDQNPHGNYDAVGTLELQPSATTTYTGLIYGGGALIKSGLGTLTLASINSYGGGTTVNVGRLIDQNPHGSYVTNADLEFETAGDVDFFDPQKGITQAIGGTGNFTKSGAGTLSVLGGLSYGGSTRVKAGTLQTLANDVLPTSTALTVDLSGTFVAAANQTVASLEGQGKVTAGGTLTVNDGTDAKFAGVISGAGSLVKKGAGTLNLTGQNGYTGTTTVAGGTLQESVDYAINGFTSAVVQTGATLDLNSHVQTFQGLTGAGSILLGKSTGSLYVHNDALDTFDGTISGAGNFTKTGYGDLTLTGTNTYTGGTYVFDGRLIVTHPFGDYVAYSILEAKTTGTQTLTGTIAGGSFVKSGNGTLTLTGVNTYAAGTTVSGGILIDQHPHGSYTVERRARSRAGRGEGRHRHFDARERHLHQGRRGHRRRERRRRDRQSEALRRHSPGHDGRP